MIPYDKDKSLLFIHIPKCGGSSLIQVIKGWFKTACHEHYYQPETASMPQKYPLKKGTCIYGHFNRKRGFGIEDYYPDAEQFITFLREPLEIAISNYFYWKWTLRPYRLELGTLKEGDQWDFRDIQDFFEKRPRSHMLDFLPRDLNATNFQNVLEETFIYIGITEDLDTSVNHLAKRLGFPQTQVERLNKSRRDEELPDRLRDKFIEENKLEYSIYNYAKSHYDIV